MCATEPRNPAVVSFNVLLADRVETHNTTMERLVELEVLVRAFDVHNVDRVEVRLKMC